MHDPRIDTHRLRLGPLRPGDAPRVRLLAGAAEVALSTRLIPHPYPEGAAEAFIAMQAVPFATSREIVFAIRLRECDELVGCIGLKVADDRRGAELGYWIGRPFWGMGYATEAARAVVAWGFDSLSLESVFAHCLATNAASARVLKKAGFTPVGTRREPFRSSDDVHALLDYQLEAPPGEQAS